MTTSQFTIIPLDFAESIANSTYLSSLNMIKKSKKRPKEQPWYKDTSKYFYTKTVTGVFGLESTKGFEELRDRMSKLIVSQESRKNLRMPFQYFKDCFTILQFRRAGKVYKDLKHFIRLDSRGYPKIIPYILRRHLHEGDRKMFLAVSTMFAIYRVIPWGPEVSFSTILEPFCGKSETLDESLILRGTGNLLRYANIPEKHTFTLSKPCFLDLRRSSPNGDTSLFSSGKDAIAFGSEPYLIIPFIKGNYKLGAYSVLCSFCSILILGIPYFGFLRSSREGILLKVFNFYLNHVYPIFNEVKIGDESKFTFSELGMGKLGVVKDQTGKSRVVGITNYGIQVALKPVHDLVLSILKDLPTDGTYDQLRPVLDLPCGEQYSSFDLTAATDRLPLKVQEQVLSKFIGEDLSKMGSRLLSFPFSYNDMPYTYSVGQPMGAYSSGAVMALTHHTIIASLFEEDERPLYAVLGDDMAITSKKGDRYKEILDILGVSISLAKSFENCYFVEFAKKLINKTNNSLDAVIGPKLIMRAMEDKYLHYNLVYEAGTRELIDITDIVGYLNKVSLLSLFDKKRIKKASSPELKFEIFRKIERSAGYLKRKAKFIDFGRFLLFGNFGLIVKNTHYAFKNGLMDGTYLSIPESPRHRTVIFEILSSKGMEQGENNKRKGLAILKDLPRGAGKFISVSGPALYPYAYALFLLSPGFGLPLRIIIRDLRSENPSYQLRRETFNEIADAPLHRRAKIIEGIHDRLFESIEKSSFISTSFDLTIPEERWQALDTYLQFSHEGDIREKHVCVTEELAKTMTGIITSPLGHPKKIKRSRPPRRGKGHSPTAARVPDKVD